MPEPLRPQGAVKGDYRLLEHTADMGIEAWAATLDALFVCAAQGLQEILFGRPCSAEPRQQQELEVEAGDREELLVAWLGEILFMVEQRGFCPALFHIEKIDRQRLRGSVVGEYQREGLRPLREVKAVTYHRLSVRRQDGGWQARIYLDL